MKPEMVELFAKRRQKKNSSEASTSEIEEPKFSKFSSQTQSSSSGFHVHDLFGEDQVEDCSASRQSLPSFSSTYIKNGAIQQQSPETLEDESLFNISSFLDEELKTTSKITTPQESTPHVVSKSEEEAPHEYVWFKKAENSQINFKIIEISYNPCVMLKTIIEVLVKDGIIVGTDCSIQDVLSKQDDEPDLKIGLSFTFLSLESLLGRSSYFYRLPAQGDQNVFDVISFCTSTQMTSVLQGMTDHSWKLLLEVLSAAKHLQTTGATEVSLAPQEPQSITESPKELLDKSNIKSGKDEGSLKKYRLVLCTTWLSVIKPVSKCFDIFSAFQSLPNADKDILRKESALEAAVIHMVANYDKETKSRVYTGIKDHILLCIKIKQYQNNQTFFESMNLLMNEFDDNMRKDDVFMSILVALSLLTERPGISRLDITNKGRRDFLDLLDKYIIAKIKSGEWTLSYDSIWNLIHRDIERISNLKLLYENLTVNPASFSQKSFE